MQVIMINNSRNTNNNSNTSNNRNLNVIDISNANNDNNNANNDNNDQANDEAGTDEVFVVDVAFGTNEAAMPHKRNSTATNKQQTSQTLT